MSLWLSRTTRSFRQYSFSFSLTQHLLSPISSPSSSLTKTPKALNPIFYSPWNISFEFSVGRFIHCRPSLTASSSGAADGAEKGGNQCSCSGSDGGPNKVSPLTSSSLTWIDLYLANSIQPYARLARLDRPIGTWLLAWPCMWLRLCWTTKTLQIACLLRNVGTKWCAEKIVPVHVMSSIACRVKFILLFGEELFWFHSEMTFLLFCLMGHQLKVCLVDLK